MSTPPPSSDPQTPPPTPPLGKTYPPGVILDKHGKPCRSCTSFRAWTQQVASTSASTPATPQPTTLPPDCPPDVEALGRATWTLLHSIAASYPPRASPAEQTQMQSFITLFSRLYPCWVCAADFREYLAAPENTLRVDSEEGSGKRGHLSGRSEFGMWMCNAHNGVNRKLGKKEFDCAKWEERWRTGWKDGRCD